MSRKKPDEVSVGLSCPGKTIAVDLNNFVAACDGTSFGVLEGEAFDTGSPQWSEDAKIKWAFSNALFFRQLADKLDAFGTKLKEKQTNG